MMKLSALAVCVIFLIVGNSSAVLGSCLVPDVTKGFERAKAVFVGEVEKITPARSTSTDAPFYDRAYLLEFKIERSWKGLPFGSIKVWALQGKEPLALTPFSKGERYLVYADPIFDGEAYTDELTVSECNRTALLPNDSKPPRVIMDLNINRENGGGDLRALDSLILKLPRR
jgi:hypothetical protein